jgi:two-component system capsular synthesis response regulator RcsB
MTQKTVAENGPSLPRKHRVIIADDHPVVLTGIGNILAAEADIHIVGAARSIAALMEALGAARCDVLVCDYSFDGDAEQDGLGMLERVIRMYPRVKVIVLSSHDDLPTIKNIIRHNIHGFIRKSSDMTNVVRAIRAVQNGKRYTDPATSELLLNYMFEMTIDHAAAVVLTTREMETLRWLRRGMTITQIAEHTHRSVKTVSSQKISAMRKLGARNDIELIESLKYHLD